MNIDLSKAQINALEVLSEQWFTYLSPHEIAQSAGISVSSVYSSSIDIVKRNIIREFNGKFRINFSNEMSWRFKMLNDSAKLFRLPNGAYNWIIEIRNKARMFYSAANLGALLVFGSAANLELTKNSDIDLMVILKKKPERSFLKFFLSENKNFNWIEKEAAEFSEGYAEGDDFIISVLKNHILLQGEDYIRHFLEMELPPSSTKVIYARESELNELKNKIDYLLQAEQPILFEKVKEFIRLKCRILLMKSSIIPKSNKELMQYMEKKYPLYHQAYKTLTRENAADKYIQLARH